MLSINQIQKDTLLKLPSIVSEETEHFLKILSEGLLDINIPHKLYLTGSLACGHYDKPKRSSYSLNKNCPYDNVIECDIRVILPPNLNLLTQSFKNTIKDLYDVPDWFIGQKTINRFGSPIDMAMMYSYKELHCDLGLEFEVCFNNDPYFEIASIWDKMFTKEEIAYQREVRTAATVLNVDYLTEFYEIKAIQNAECRYRICADIYHDNGILDLNSYDSSISRYLLSRVHNNYVNRNRPTLEYNLTNSLKFKFENSGLEHLIYNPPIIPYWLESLEKIKISVDAA